MIIKNLCRYFFIKNILELVNTEAINKIKKKFSNVVNGGKNEDSQFYSLVETNRITNMA